MSGLTVIQLSGDGFFIGTLQADPDPRVPGSFLIPSGCIVADLPTIPENSTAKWTGSDWLYEAIPEPEPEPEPSNDPAPEWVDFNNALLADATWGALSEQLPVQVLIGIVSASVAGNPVALQFALDTAKTVMASLGTPIPVEALAGWQAIADLHYIPITF